MDEFCREKGIKREYSVARTPQQNGVAKRKNRTLIEAARTMLADSKLPTTFWAEAISTACYVQNRVLIVKPHNKTPYELFRGIKPAIGFMKPFGCHVTILNTLSSKAFRVYNIRTRKVQENLHIGFLENKPMIEGNGPKWLFDLDSLTQSMNYVPVVAGTFSNDFAGIQGVSESSSISSQLRINIQDKDRLHDEYDATEKVFLYDSLILKEKLKHPEPDIMFAVCACARILHWTLVAYTDSDLCGASKDRKSTIGVVTLTVSLLANPDLSRSLLKKTYQLEDHDGITFIPNLEIFEQLCNSWGYQTDSDKDHISPSQSSELPRKPTFEPQPLLMKSFHVVPSPNESPSPCLFTHIRNDLRVALSNRIDGIWLQLSERIGVLENELKRTKQTYSSAFTKLILMIKKRKISDIDEDPNTYFAQDDEVVHDQYTYCRKTTEDSNDVKRQGRIKGFKYLIEPDLEKSQEDIWNKRDRFIEAFSLQEHVDEEERAQVARDEEILRQLLVLDEERVTTETKTTKDIYWNDPSVQRQDIVELYRLVKERYSSSKPEGYDLMLWGDLHTLFEPDEESEIWMNQNEYDMIKKKYPLSQEMISKMMSKRLEVDQESTQAFYDLP
ncbi:ribonuclease H-like domain-containing protein [Tanacetum coccineum]